jgi:hypothetical protein
MNRMTNKQAYNNNDARTFRIFLIGLSWQSLKSYQTGQAIIDFLANIKSGDCSVVY